MVLIYPHNLFIFSALSLSMPMSSNSPSHSVSVLPQVISQLKNQYFVMFLFIAEASDIEFDVPTATTTTPSESGRSRRRRLARGESVESWGQTLTFSGQSSYRAEPLLEWKNEVVMSDLTDTMEHSPTRFSLCLNLYF